MKTDLFQFCGHCWLFQICQCIEGSTLSASRFSILNSSAGIPSPPIALFVVMLPKAHLTSYSRMSGSRWVTTTSRLSGSLKPFLYSSVHSCYFFLISFASIRSLTFLSFIVHILAWNVVLISPIFLKRSLVFPLSIVFLYFFALFTHKGFLISPCYSLLHNFYFILSSLTNWVICSITIFTHLYFNHLQFNS